MVDSGSWLIWSRHKDGKIRSWKMDKSNFDESPFKEGVSCQAHRASLLSMVIYGQDRRVVILGFGHGNLLKNLSLYHQKRDTWLLYLWNGHLLTLGAKLQ